MLDFKYTLKDVREELIKDGIVLHIASIRKAMHKLQLPQKGVAFKKSVYYPNGCEGTEYRLSEFGKNILVGECTFQYNKRHKEPIVPQEVTYTFKEPIIKVKEETSHTIYYIIDKYKTDYIGTSYMSIWNYIKRTNMKERGLAFLHQDKNGITKIFIKEEGEKELLEKLFRPKKQKKADKSIIINEQIEINEERVKKELEEKHLKDTTISINIDSNINQYLEVASTYTGKPKEELVDEMIKEYVFNVLGLLMDATDKEIKKALEQKKWQVEHLFKAKV